MATLCTAGTHNDDRRHQSLHRRTVVEEAHLAVRDARLLLERGEGARGDILSGLVEEGLEGLGGDGEVDDGEAVAVLDEPGEVGDVEGAAVVVGAGDGVDEVDGAPEALDAVERAHVVERGAPDRDELGALGLGERPGVVLGE